MRGQGQLPTAHQERAIAARVASVAPAHLERLKLVSAGQRPTSSASTASETAAERRPRWTSREGGPVRASAASPSSVAPGWG